jgi:lipoprotein-anchoring transpeptidase ErfK/SrfK
MSSDFRNAKHALKNALKKLHRGDQVAAREWAQRAVELSPGLEEGWLILASLSEPRTSLEYIKEALRINPDSPGARQGLLEVQNRLENTCEEGPSQPLQTVNPGSGKKNTRHLLSWVRLFPVYVLAILSIVVLTQLVLKSRIVNAFSLPSSESQPILLQPMATSASTMTSQTSASDSSIPLPADPSFLTFLSTETPSPMPEDNLDPSAASSPLLSPATDLPGPSAMDVPRPPAPENNPDLSAASDPLLSPAPDLPGPSAMDVPRPPAPENNPDLSAASDPLLSPAPDLPGPSAMDVAQPPAAEAATGEKRIIVNITEQHLYAFQGDTLVLNFIVSTGADNSTSVGIFSIVDKIPDAYSDLWGFWMPDWLGLYALGDMENGLHALPVLADGTVIWEDALGKPISHGCVVMNPDDARSLFEWADIGTPVEILP